MARLHQLFRSVFELGASDLHLASGLEPRIRIAGLLQPVEGWATMASGEMRAILREIVSAEQWRRFEETGDLDFAYSLETLGRFRANYFEQENGAAAVFRRIPEEILSLEELGLPKVVGDLADLESGLVLVTGPTGSGKSTTLAALVDRMNTESARHILTIEDPVEFIHREKRCAISQREVGIDTESFGAALKAGMRQDADVILVGEMRDLETIGLAVRAAEMGVLVLGTLHTNSAAKTIDRLIDVFPADEQSAIRSSLSSSLAAVVAQILLPTPDGKSRVAACEILLRTRGLGNVIREANTPMIRSIIQAGRARGMRSMDDALLELVRAGTITARVAHRRAFEKKLFEDLLRRESGQNEAAEIR
ncbi:MAG: PilT/PilU family type 4a pilus ATPase [Acidobacteriota bacterium]|nr:PilT/PilU family type 4a pilus ATPase [Acidobacteriota bacterium]MDH3522516.1 PilT/PilU family type 4a pilus ATPase [Acidobacteriota bacterium]